MGNNCSCNNEDEFKEVNIETIRIYRRDFEIDEKVETGILSDEDYEDYDL